MLVDILPDIKCLELHLMRVWPADDKFTQGFRDTTRTKVLPTWLVFAGQIFLDVYHTMRPDIARGFSELNKAADLAVKSIKAETKHAQRYHTAHTDNVQDIAFSVAGEKTNETWHSPSIDESSDGETKTVAGKSQNSDTLTSSELKDSSLAIQEGITNLFELSMII